MENMMEKLAVTILLELLKDSRRAKKMLPALRKVYNALGLFLGPSGDIPAAAELKPGR